MADPRGTPWTPAPPSIQILLFSCIFQETFCKIIIWRPTLGNPGSATDLCVCHSHITIYFKKMDDVIIMNKFSNILAGDDPFHIYLLHLYENHDAKYGCSWFTVSNFHIGPFIFALCPLRNRSMRQTKH